MPRRQGPSGVDLGISDFLELAYPHAGAIHAYLKRRVGRDQADDLLGEVWVQAFRSRHGYDDQASNPRPWLFGIARNVLRAHWRKKYRRHPELEAAIVDPWPEIDDQIDATARRHDLVEALRLLSESEREVLLLAAWEQLTPAEIALVLQIPQGTVRSRLYRSRSVMKGELSEAGSDTECGSLFRK